MSVEMKSILFVDDDPDVRKTAELLLRKHRFIVHGAASPQEAMSRIVADPVDLILLDLNFSKAQTSGEEGLACLADILRHDPQANIIVVTGHSGLNVAIQALRNGARDFIMKPWNNERLVQAIEKVLASRRTGNVSVVDPSILVGSSDAMRRIIATFDRCAALAVSVLIRGEAGTGKTLGGLMLHRQSGRTNLVQVEAGALSDAALSDIPDTTLLVENIERLNEAQIAGLLGWLTRAPRHNSRLISTTTLAIADLGLDRRVKYAISTVDVGMPPLRERGDDIVQLAEHFVRVSCLQHGFSPKTLSLEAQAILASQPWPDNIHALRHAIERTVIMLDGASISAGDLALDASAVSVDAPAKPNLAASEKTMIEEALRRNNFNVSAAAGELGLTRPSLYRRMSKHGI
jgi:DNA-binding NtrC family response regulator